MHLDQKGGVPVATTWQGMIAFSAIVALAVFLFWLWRDGFAWGDVLGAVLIGVLTFAVLAALRRFRRM